MLRNVFVPLKTILATGQLINLLIRPFPHILPSRGYSKMNPYLKSSYINKWERVNNSYRQPLQRIYRRGFSILKLHPANCRKRIFNFSYHFLKDFTNITKFRKTGGIRFTNFPEISLQFSNKNKMSQFCSLVRMGEYFQVCGYKLRMR